MVIKHSLKQEIDIEIDCVFQLKNKVLFFLVIILIGNTEIKFLHLFQRGTVELKKYLCSRIESPQPVESTQKGIQNGGDTGIVGGTGEGLNAHDIKQSKAFDYRYGINKNYRYFKKGKNHNCNEP